MAQPASEPQLSTTEKLSKFEQLPAELLDFILDGIQDTLPSKLAPGKSDDAPSTQEVQALTALSLASRHLRKATSMRLFLYFRSFSDVPKQNSKKPLLFLRALYENPTLRPYVKHLHLAPQRGRWQRLEVDRSLCGAVWSVVAMLVEKRIGSRQMREEFSRALCNGCESAILIALLLLVSKPHTLSFSLKSSCLRGTYPDPACGVCSLLGTWIGAILAEGQLPGGSYHELKSVHIGPVPREFSEVALASVFSTVLGLPKLETLSTSGLHMAAGLGRASQCPASNVKSLHQSNT